MKLVPLVHLWFAKIKTQDVFHHLAHRRTLIGGFAFELAKISSLRTRIELIACVLDRRAGRAQLTLNCFNEFQLTGAAGESLVGSYQINMQGGREGKITGIVHRQPVTLG